MQKSNTIMNRVESDNKRMDSFVAQCRAHRLKVTPQRVVIYKALVDTDEHPSAEALHKKIKKVYPHISLDTVNRTLLTLAEVGAACVVEGSGDAKRFDGSLERHQHFKCVRCKRIVDFHHRAFDRIKVPDEIGKRFTVLRKTVYLEGICDMCRKQQNP